MKKENVLEEIARLQKASPADAQTAFEPIKAAVEEFFISDEELEKCVRDSVFQVACNYEYRNTFYEHQALMPSFSDNFPIGYEDVRVLFEAGGVWKEIEAMQDGTFVKAFKYEAPETGSEEVAVNPFLEDWTARIEAARAEIVPGLQAIIDFCENGATNNGLAVYFEEHGQLVSAPTRRETAKRVYIIGGYMEIIQTYGLDVHIPSYYQGVES